MALLCSREDKKVNIVKMLALGWLASSVSVFPGNYQLHFTVDVIINLQKHFPIQ